MLRSMILVPTRLPLPVRLLLLLPLLALGGCIAGTIHLIGRATGLKPPAWDGFVQVSTDPPGQRCIAERDGQVLVLLDATPGRMAIPRSAFPYQLRCTGPGTLETVHVFRPEPDPGAFVPLPTGVVGIVMLTAAVASGSINRFPPEVVVASPPAEFPDAAARQAWFAPQPWSSASENRSGRRHNLAWASRKAPSAREDWRRSRCAVGMPRQASRLSARRCVLPAMRRPGDEVARGSSVECVSPASAYR
jgi:hypothetical protein